MRNRVSVVVRLFAMVAMTLGLATMMSTAATAQETETVQCQTIIGGVISQEDCVVEVTEGGQCNVTLPDGTVLQNQGCTPEGCPSQIVLANGDIIQFQCSGVTQPTQAPPTATVAPGVTPTATVAPGVTPTATPVTPGATQTPVTPGATQAPDVPGEALPDTGQGSTSSQSNSANVLLLSALAAILSLGAVAMRLRNNS